MDDRTDTTADVLVVGAGVSGLIAARQLTASGAQVVVVDKGRGPGGRLATRRLTAPTVSSSAIIRVDHGAQFFTVRSDEFADLMADWPVHEWHRGPSIARSVTDDPASRGSGGDGHPRYAGRRGMNGIAKHLARGLDVRTSTRVDGIRATAQGWCASAGPSRWLAPRVLLTCPVPQTLALLAEPSRQGEVLVPTAVRELSYDPCVGLLVPFTSTEAEAGFAFQSAVQFAEGPVHYMADNATKGIADLPAVTIHASADWSREHFDDDDSDIRASLLSLAGPWLGQRCNTVDAGAATPAKVEPYGGGNGTDRAQVKRWRYSSPVKPHPERAVEIAPGLVLAGDAFGEAKVEGAARSGIAAAALLRR